MFLHLVANTRRLVIWPGFCGASVIQRATGALIATWNEQAIKSHFAQSARAVALTVCPHTQVQLSLSWFTPTFCNVPLPDGALSRYDVLRTVIAVRVPNGVLIISWLGR
jgi:hypothetical protein